MLVERPMPGSDNAVIREFSERVSQRAAAGVDLPDAVAEMLPMLLSNADTLAPEHRRAMPNGYARHPLYRHPSGLFSIQVMVFGPGMATPIHDHCSWCVVGVQHGE